MPDWTQPRSVSRVPCQQWKGDYYADIVRFENDDRHVLVKGVASDTVRNCADAKFPAYFEHLEDEMENMERAAPSDSEVAELLRTVQIWGQLISFASPTQFITTSPEALAEFTEVICGRLRGHLSHLTCIIDHLLDILQGNAERIDELSNSEKISNDANSSNSSSFVGIIGMTQDRLKPVRQEELRRLELILRERRLSELFMRIVLSASDQTLFRTASGKLGMASYCIQNGDEIFMYPGSPHPAIIRRLDNENYHCITQANVSGLMSHDVFPEDKDRLEYFTFE